MGYPPLPWPMTPTRNRKEIAMKHEIWVFAVKAFVVILLVAIAIAILDWTSLIDLGGRGLGWR